MIESRGMPARDAEGSVTVHDAPRESSARAAVVTLVFGAIVGIALVDLARVLTWDGPGAAPTDRLLVTASAAISKPFLLRLLPRPRRALAWFASGLLPILLLGGLILLT